jgi:hypothetical protein
MALSHPTYSLTIRQRTSRDGAWSEPMTLTGLTANQALMVEQDWSRDIVAVQPER